MDSLTVWIYVACIAGIGLFVLVRALYWLDRSRQQRRAVVEEKERFEAIRTKTPISNPTTVAKERALESIETHFSVTRRVLVPVVLGVTGVLVSLPFLAKAPAAVVPVYAAAVTVLLGLAVRPLLENAIAGLVISSSRMVRIGDTVRVDDMYGTVEDITPTHTTIKIWDWRRYLVPNSRMLQSAFFNYSLFDTFQWAYVEFWVSYDADLERVREIAVSAPSTSQHFSNAEPPKFWLVDLERDAVRCWVAAWANTPSEAWALTHDIRTELVRALQIEGITTHLQHHELQQSKGTTPTSKNGRAPFPASSDVSTGPSLPSPIPSQA